MGTLPFISSIAIAAVCVGCGGIAFTGLTAAEAVERDPSPAIAFASSPTPSPPVASPGAGRWRRAPDGLFYVDASVNGASIRFLVDTGASVTVLTAADAARVRAATTGVEATLSTVGGGTPMRWTRLRRVALRGLAVGDVSAAILTTPGGVSLLGQDVLRQARSVSIEADELRIS